MDGRGEREGEGGGEGELGVFAVGRLAIWVVNSHQGGSLDNIVPVVRREEERAQMERGRER